MKYRTLSLTSFYRDEGEYKQEAREIYTRTIFYDIQEEICAAITDCMSMSQMTIDGTHKFCIKEIGPEVSSLGLFEVLFTPSDVTLSCSCKRFERYGLLCQHSFYALRICGVSEFPKRYVSRRWTRDAVTREKRIVFDGRNKFSDESIRDEIVKDIIGSVEYCIDKLASNKEQDKHGNTRTHGHNSASVVNPFYEDSAHDPSLSKILQR
ncbi:FAR1-related sequence 5-like protein [Tanacetum coccineum]